jgi:glycosyltransferase involved in cell wall biosynthesis/SAM-dependent methyltransferase
MQQSPSASTFQIFYQFDRAEAAMQQPAAAEFYLLLEKLRAAVRSRSPHWADYPNLVAYASICFWAIRKLEYSFAAEAFGRIESDAGHTPLRVLDIGCGVVPFCNWTSLRGHDVTAIDPLDADIEFLSRNDLNGFYGSHVDYRVGRSEQLEFEEETFDVVTCISVLEHIPPGNDRLSLWEMGRVLKPGGHLIVSFDVSPPPLPQAGQQSWPSDHRRYANPFSPDAATRFLESMASAFETSAAALPAELRRLTWDDVHAFWRAAMTHDERDDPIREYLAMGGVLRRRPALVAVPLDQITAAYLEGQQALEERVEFYASHARQRMDLVQRLDEVGQVLREEVKEKELAIVELSTAAQQKEQVIVELSSSAQEKEQVIGELSSVADERQRLIESLDAVAGERLSLVEDMQRQDVALHEQMAVLHEALNRQVNVIAQQTEALERLSTAVAAGIQQSHIDAETRVDTQMLLLRRDKEMAEAAAAARLEVIDEQQRALEAFRSARTRFRISERWSNSFSPRIGQLYQYAPRPLTIPESYRRPRKLSAPPTISIVTASLNQGLFIERTLRSVLDQHYPELEYIVQDGGSTDETAEILRTYSRSLTSAVSESDRGLADGLNRGFRFASGDILAYLNSDDILLPGALNYVAWYFSRHPDVDVVYGHRVVIDEYDAEIGRWVLPPHDDKILSWADFIPQETLFWRRRTWEQIGAAVDESLRFAVDWDLLLRFREAGARMQRLPRFLGGFRVHPHQKTSAELLDVGASEMSRLRQRALGRSVSQHEVDTALRPYFRRHIYYHKLYRLGLLRY